MRLFICD